MTIQHTSNPALPFLREGMIVDITLYFTDQNGVPTEDECGQLSGEIMHIETDHGCPVIELRSDEIGRVEFSLNPTDRVIIDAPEPTRKTWLNDPVELKELTRFLSEITYEPRADGRLNVYQRGEPMMAFKPYSPMKGKQPTPTFQVSVASIEIAENFFAMFLIGLASLDEIETWTPVQ